MTDAQIVAALGGPSALLEPLSIKLDAARKFTLRGIPWKYRPAVQRLAKAKKVKLPADFLEKQRVS